MSFRYEDKQINSVYIDKIWHTYTTSAGVYTANLDGNWDIIIFKAAEFIYVTVNGVGKEAVEVPYVAGVDSVGIALKPGVFLRDLKGKDIVDSQHVLTDGGTQYVQLGRRQFKIPDFASAEAFINELIEAAILVINPVVVAFYGENKVSVSDRTLRRHVAQTTGLTPHFFQQIRRAQHATQLLQTGTPIAQAAVEAGYTDQAHMTKAVKLLMGRTPAQIIAVSGKQ